LLLPCSSCFHFGAPCYGVAVAAIRVLVTQESDSDLDTASHVWLGNGWF